MQEHGFSFEVEATPMEVWKALHPRLPSMPSGERFVIEHGDVRIEIVHPGDDDGVGLVRQCWFNVPRYLLSGGRARSWEVITDSRPGEYSRYEAVGKPLWSQATGWHRLDDLGDGTTRVTFGETYEAFNPIARRLLEARVHRFISKDNDRLIKAAVEAGVAPAGQGDVSPHERNEDDRAIEAAVRSAASATGVPFEVVPCDAALADTAAFCEAYGYAMEDSANCVVVIGKADPPVFAACVVLATTRLDVNGVVRRRLGTRKASFAPADDVVTATGMAIGGVTPLALPDGLPLWVDARVMDRERIVLGAGSRHAKVLAPPGILTALGAEVVDDLAKPET